MVEYKYIYGPVPSRRLGLSLGISPIPKKTCNYSCIYCQLGRTNHMTNTKKMFYPVNEIVHELKECINNGVSFDVVTIVGEGEPTLYLGLGELIVNIKNLIDKPVAVITNGALLYDKSVQNDLKEADIVLPTLDAYNEELFKKINRPHKNLEYCCVLSGLKEFSLIYKGQIWIEIMLMKNVNDSDYDLEKYKDILKTIRYDKLYINTPIRPPAESNVHASDHERVRYAADYLNGLSIDLLASTGFQSSIKDDYEAILSIIKRHPMNQYEIESFLNSRNVKNIKDLLRKLNSDVIVNVLDYKGYKTYRLK